MWLCPTLDNVTPFNDLSDQGNNGTAVGGLATISDTSSGGAYAYDFDGTDDYIDVTSSGVPASAYSVSLWQYSTRSVNNNAFNAGDTSGNRTVNIAGVKAGQSGDNHGHKSGGTSYWVSNPTVRTSATWYHYLLTYDGSELKLYVNGVYVANLTGVPNTNWTESRCWVGQYIGSGFFFQGRMDDIRTYGRPLTQSEITHLATARGIEGRPFDGLGDEQLWLCPSLENSPNDLSGNNNNGVYNGGMGTVTSDGKLAYDFDGSDDYLEIPSSTSLRIDNPSGIAITAWVNPDTVSGGDTFSQTNPRYIFAKGNTGNEFNYAVRLLGGRLDFLFRNSTNTAYVNVREDVASLSAGSWYHVSVSGDSSGYSLYVDGVAVASTVTGTISESPIINANPARLGTEGGNNQRYLNGKVDDLRLYNRALTQAEISWLATERGVLGTPPAGLGDEQLWLCPSIQDSANDISANNNHGTYVGGMGTISDVAEGGSLAYDFDGTDDYIKVDNSIEFGAVSVSCWVYSDNIASRYRVFDSYDLSRSSGSPDIAIQNENGQGMRVFSQISGTQATPYTTIQQSQWYHICSVSDGTNLSLYIDGSLAASVACTTTPQSDQAWIGARGGGTLEWLDGKMDDIRAYNRVLAQEEITHLASQRGVLGTPPEGLGDEQLWLCPSIQDSANDLSGNGNDGVYNGGMGTVADTAEGGSLAYDFDGTDDYIDCGTASSPTDLTMSVWVNVLSSPASTAGVVGNAQSGGVNGEYLIWTQGSNARALIYTNGTSGTATLPSNTWVHLVATRDTAAGFVYLYLDGVVTQQVAITSTHPTLTRDFIVGSFQNGFYFSGLMDDIRFYDRALNQDEISWLATERGVLGTPPEGLGGEQLWLCPSIQDSANDLSGNGNDGAYFGGMGTVADTSNGGSLAYDFDGVDDRIDCPSTVLGGSQLFSMSCWVYIDAHDATYGEGFMGQWNNESASDKVAFIQAGAATSFRGFLTAGGSNYTSAASGAAPPTGAWHHLASVVDGSNVTLYVDGVSQGSTAYSGSIESLPSNAFEVGRYKGSGVNSNVHCLDGKMDDIRAYNRVLTQSEITHLASQRGVLGPASGPPASVFFNPFKSNTFFTLDSKRIR